MTTDEFIRLVQQMRAAQKAYFRRSTPEGLESAKALERQVDKAAAELRDKQGTLFGEVK